MTAKVVIDPNNITMTEQDGIWVGSMQFLAIGGNVEKGQFDESKTMLGQHEVPAGSA